MVYPNRHVRLQTQQGRGIGEASQGFKPKPCKPELHQAGSPPRLAQKSPFWLRFGKGTSGTGTPRKAQAAPTPRPRQIPAGDWLVWPRHVFFAFVVGRDAGIMIGPVAAKGGVPDHLLACIKHADDVRRQRKGWIHGQQLADGLGETGPPDIVGPLTVDPLASGDCAASSRQTWAPGQSICAV